MEKETKKKKSGVLLKILAGVGLAFLILIVIFWFDDSDEDYDEYADYDTEYEEKTSSQYKPTFANVENVSVGTDAKTATIMIYVNGSDLESEGGEATEDIGEMIASGIGENVNVILQTMGTRYWQGYGISSNTAQTYQIKDGGLNLLRDNLGQLDCTSESTLSEFIHFCKENYPADRYMFLFWDHGGGPVYGFGYDEWQSEDSSLTLDEMAKAFAENSDVHFDIIGMDCCIMASMETCFALAPFAKYALLSEDFESGLGWSYTNWMKTFEKHPGISTPVLGKYIVDDIIYENEQNYEGDSACIGLFNLSTSKNLFEAWRNFAYKNEAALLDKNYSRSHKSRGRFFFGGWDEDDSDVTLSDYYISDILALVENIDKDSDEAKNLISALKASVAYYGHTEDKNELTGLAVSLPYGDAEFYSKLKAVYKEIGLDESYINWLEAFVGSRGYSDYYDYDSFEDSWGGWSYYEDDYGCNISNGSCSYGYDYGYGYDSGSYDDDWLYDYEMDLWYCYEGNNLYLYDDNTQTTYYYDDYDGTYYYYDDVKQDWFEYVK